MVIEIYKITKNFPKDEMYALSQRIKRAAVAIPSNIAEGYGRQYGKEYKQFLPIAYGSLCELETQYLLSIDLNYKNEPVENLMKEASSMLYRMLNPIHYPLTAK